MIGILTNLKQHVIRRISYVKSESKKERALKRLKLSDDVFDRFRKDLSDIDDAFLCVHLLLNVSFFCKKRLTEVSDLLKKEKCTDFMTDEMYERLSVLVGGENIKDIK